jgi:hypothetical protein
MNRERAKELLPIIKAFANGGVVQFRYSKNMKWQNTSDDPVFVVDNEYRIKPEPMEIWVNIYDEKEDDVMGATYSSKVKAENYASFGVIKKAVKFREVIE